MRRLVVPLLPLLVCGCPVPPAKPTPPASRVVTILGTSDTHGALDRLPILAGYVANMRAARDADHGGVVLVDAGDLFQGTLESNLTEGVAVIEAYNRMGYTAAAIGNHEFDFGPAGPANVAKNPGEDPRGALLARVQEARFPMLAGNVAVAATGATLLPASTTVTVAGVRVGIVGVTTEATPFTTTPANFVGLTMLPTAAVIEKEAAALRTGGATLIVVAAHIGSRCKDLAHPDDASTCDRDSELWKLADALPAGLVDVIVAGHTHAGVAHRVNGIAIVESYASGRAFGRVDLRVGADGKVQGVEIHPPRDLCQGDKAVEAAACVTGDYEGRPVARDAAVQAIADRAIAAARPMRDQPLGVTLAGPFTRSYGEESAEGNLFADLMREARPPVDLAMTNGGGLRADLPAGPLIYGSLYEAMPFDNRLVTVTLTGAQLRQVVAQNLGASSGVYSYSGITVEATCKGSELVVTMRDRAGKVIGDERSLKLLTSDFMASGGDGSAIGRLGLPPTAFAAEDVLVRDVLAEALRGKKAELRPGDVYDRAHRRLVLPSKRPVKCGATPPSR